MPFPFTPPSGINLPKIYFKLLAILNLAGKFNKQQRWLFKNASKPKFVNLRDVMLQEAVRQGRIARSIAVRKKNPQNKYTVEIRME